MTPACRATSRPFLNSARVGMLRILYCAPNAGSASVFTLARRTCGSSIPAACAKAGPMILQGPHHGAQKSMSIGMSLRSRCLTKVTAVNSTGWLVNNGWWHCPQLGFWPSLAAGTRLTAWQCGQTRCKESLMRFFCLMARERFYPMFYPFEHQAFPAP
jgi:hypothetical protein